LSKRRRKLRALSLTNYPNRINLVKQHGECHKSVGVGYLANRVALDPCGGALRHFDKKTGARTPRRESGRGKQAA